MEEYFIDAPSINARPPVVLYCDFDGVINMFPFRTKEVPNISQHTYEDIPGLAPIPRDNSAINDELSGYVLDYLEKVKDIYLTETPSYPRFDSRATVSHQDSMGTMRDIGITWSSEVISLFTKLIAEGLIEFRWCTTWNEQANNNLAPVLGIPQSPQVPLNPPGFFDRNWNVEKYWWVHDLHSEVDPNSHKDRWVQNVFNSHHESLLEDTRPFIWLDDIATSPYAMEPISADSVEYGYPTPRNAWKEMGEDIIADDYLIIATDRTFGISLQEMRAVESFARKYSTQPPRSDSSQ